MFMHIDANSRAFPPHFPWDSLSATIIAIVLAASAAWAGLGVFVNGTELDGAAQTGRGWQFMDGVLTVSDTKEDQYTVISGENRNGDVSVCVKGNARIRLSNLSLRTQESNSTPFRITGGREVILSLSGENRLEAGPLCAGLQLERGADRVVITNAPGEPSARLIAIGGAEGAGIGGASLDTQVKKLVVSGGRIEAQGGKNAAGIGGGLDGTMQEFLLEGGTVVARGGENGDDVGGGPYGSVMQVTVMGGSLDAIILNDVPKRNYHSLRKIILRTPDWRPGDPVVADFSDYGVHYGSNAVFTDETGAVHLWFYLDQLSFLANGTRFSVPASSTDITIDLSNISFRSWCRHNGFVPEPAADAGGEAALVRYAFGRPFGIPPVPEIDASGTYPVLRIPDVRRSDVTVRCFGSPDLSIPKKQWVEFFPDKYDQNLWVARQKLPENPSSFFARLEVATDLPPVVSLQVGTNVFSVELAKTDAAEQLRQRFPLTLTMDKHYVTDRHADLDFNLPTSRIPAGIVEIGDFYLLQPNRLILSLHFSQQAGFLTPIGKVEDIDGFVEAIGEGSVEMTFR